TMLIHYCKGSIYANVIAPRVQPKMAPAPSSRTLSQFFTERWMESNPGAIVLRRDLTTTALVTVNEAWITAVYTPAVENHGPEGNYCHFPTSWSPNLASST